MNLLRKMNKLPIIETDLKVKLGESIIQSGIHDFSLGFDVMTPRILSASHRQANTANLITN